TNGSGSGGQAPRPPHPTLSPGGERVLPVHPLPRGDLRTLPERRWPVGRMVGRLTSARFPAHFLSSSSFRFSSSISSICFRPAPTTILRTRPPRSIRTNCGSNVTPYTSL